MSQRGVGTMNQTAVKRMSRLLIGHLLALEREPHGIMLAWAY